jgi:hypothetical protein
MTACGVSPEGKGGLGGVGSHNPSLLSCVIECPTERFCEAFRAIPDWECMFQNGYPQQVFNYCEEFAQKLVLL